MSALMTRGQRRPASSPFVGPFECSAWFERDRAALSLTDANGREVFALFDDAVFEAIEDGFLNTPRFATRASNSAWLPLALEYAREQGLIPKEGA